MNSKFPLNPEYHPFIYFKSDRLLERPHQSLGNLTPDVVYRTAIGGGAMIVDKYPSEDNAKKSENKEAKTKASTKNEVNVSTGQRRPAVNVVEATS